MWRFQKPGFEALVLAELQRQQQCNQFCDTLLKTGDILVPAHSCVLSAVSPHISSALSSTPTPPSGQSRLLEFRALGTCALLHMIRLLYCGEMAGEGEEEKQEAISAAARLGIHGLVEVTKGGRRSTKEGGDGRQAEVGVQTEPLMCEDSGGRLSRWRKEVKDGTTFLWKDVLSDGKKDSCTQTEELQIQTDLPSHPAAFETIDMDAIQSIGQTNSHLIPSEIPSIPISLIYPSDETPTHHPPSALLDATQESAGHTCNSAEALLYTSAPPPRLFAGQATPCADDFQSSCPVFQARGAAAEEWEERLEQFQGDIPGYISYFLNPDKKEGFQKPGRGRARGRRGAGVGGARGAGTSESGTRRPRARAEGRGRGGMMQTVAEQEVGLSRLQKLFLQRWRPSRTGQGGGAAGRKLHLKTRTLLKSTKSCQRRRGRGKEFSEWCEFSEGGCNTQQRKRSATQQGGRPAGRAQRGRATPEPVLSFCSGQSSAFSPSPSPAAFYMPPAPSVLHTTSLPPPPHEEQPEHFDRLLEEVMMGLDILPNKNDDAPHSQPPASSRVSSSKQPGRSTGLLQAQPGCHGYRQVVEANGGGGSSSEAPVLLQGEGELNDMLDNFLQSFEQHIDRCAGGEEEEPPYGALSKNRHTPQPQNTSTPSPAASSQITEQSDEAETRQTPRKASARRAAPPKCAEGKGGRPPKRRRKNVYLFSLEKKKARKLAPTSETQSKSIHERRNEQLQQSPVVKLRKSGPLPATLHLQEVKSPAKAKTRSPPVKCPHDKKTYPIRSRFRGAQEDVVPCVEEPLHVKRARSAGRTSGSCSRTSKNGQRLTSSDGRSSTPPNQLQPTEPCGEDKRREGEEERLQPQEGAPRRGEKRRAETETSDESAVAKRARCEPSSQAARSAAATEEVNGVSLQRRDHETTLGETEGSWTAEETLHVDGDPGDVCRRSRTSPRAAVSPSRSAKELNPCSKDEEDDEDIDVVASASPPPDPVVITWTDSSEDEDIDVIGENTGDASCAAFMSTGELVDRKYKTEVLSL